MYITKLMKKNAYITQILHDTRYNIMISIIRKMTTSKSSFAVTC